MAKEKAIEITVERKLVALATKLASAPVTQAQKTVLAFAPAVVTVPALVIIGQDEAATILEALPELDAMQLARAFMAQEANAQGLSPQQLYALSPLFWSAAGEQAGKIALVSCPDGQFRASGLLSAALRASEGFTDHLHQLIGKQAGGVTLIKPSAKAPALPKATFNSQGSNAAFALALVEGFKALEDLPTVAVKASKASSAPADLDPWADLDGWIN